jgi:hypothetical protein
MALLRLTLMPQRRRETRRQGICSVPWIPSFLFPPKAGVLLHYITSQNTLRPSGRYVCIMLHTLVVSCLTVCTHLHSQQKASASQPLPLEMEKAGGKRARSTSPSSARETRSKHRRSGTKSICFSNFLRNSEKLLKFS